MTRRKHTILILLATALSLGHHADHIFRGNHLGWPLTQEVTPFTLSLGVYAVILPGLVLHLLGRVGPAFWAIVAGSGFLFVGLTHFGPVAAEPPEDIIRPYASPIAGWAAFGLLLMFLALLAGLAWYEARTWWKMNRTKA